MVRVALIGADGAGKTTLARRLEGSQELPIKYLYMGVSASASNHMLPTTRVLRALRHALGRGELPGPPDPARAAARPRRGLRGLAHGVKSSLVLANRLCEEAYRSALARRLERRGWLVLFDRHFYADYWAHDVKPAARTLSQRVHGRFLARLRRPDCTILLDAPAEVLFARKPEGTLAAVERRRQEYLQLARELGDVVVVDAARPSLEVEAEVLRVLRRVVGAEARPS